MKNSIEYLEMLHKQEILEDVLNAKEFVEILDKDLINKRNNVLIENNMLIHDNMNVGYLCDLKVQFPNDIGKNINIKLYKMICKINITNEFIVESNKWFEYIKNNKGKVFYLNTYSFNKIEKCNEIIIHDIKKYIEILLEIDWILRNPKATTIKYDSLGQIIFKNDEKNNFAEFDRYEGYEKFFEQINDIDNSFKHSFVNDIETFCGMEKNCITVIESKKKNKEQKINEGEKILYIILDDMIKQFNDFLRFSIDNINKIIAEIEV
ncbi:MAG: hypothetical protein Q4C11_02120 [Clostridium sp.]|nr:hypothetical protein [Clostridium sp.]